MHCQRCQKSLRSSEGVKCEECESRFHMKCVTSPRELEGGDRGDRGYQWKCAVCQHPAGRCSSQSQILLNTINQLTDKLETLNKIQLPKLNTDLLLIRSTTERIVRQNEDLLYKMNQLHKSEKRAEPESDRAQGLTRPVERWTDPKRESQPRSRRRKPFVISKSAADDGEEVPIVAPEKCVRYKTRRRSYHLYKMLRLVNTKLHRSRTPRNKSPR